MKLILLLLLLVNCVFCASWLDLFFPRPSSYSNQNNGPYRQYRQGRGGKERWKEICRTINVDPYAFPGRAPYPVGPVCPW